MVLTVVRAVAVRLLALVVVRVVLATRRAHRHHKVTTAVVRLTLAGRVTMVLLVVVRLVRVQTQRFKAEEKLVEQAHHHQLLVVQ
jgi:hypothetical protein